MMMTMMTAILRRRLRPCLTLRSAFSTSSSIRMKVIPVPVREDNYAYLLVDDTSNKAAAVDPYDVPKVKAAVDKAGVQLVAAITTHHHFDHSGGNQVCVPCQRRERTLVDPITTLSPLCRHLYVSGSATSGLGQYSSPAYICFCTGFRISRHPHLWWQRESSSCDTYRKR